MGKDEQTEEKTRQIPPIKFSKPLLEKLCRIIDEEYSEVTQKGHYYSLDLAYAYNNGISSTYHNILSFVENLKYKSLNHISIYFYSPTRKINTEISVKGGSSYIRIIGIDPTWVRGTSERLFEIFDEYKLEVNSFIHSRKGWIPWIIFGISLIVLFYYFLLKSTSPIFVFFMPVNITVWGYWFFEWIYPKVETEEIIQVRFRKLILSATVLISALITILGVFVKF